MLLKAIKKKKKTEVKNIRNISGTIQVLLLLITIEKMCSMCALNFYVCKKMLRLSYMYYISKRILLSMYVL